MDDQLLKQQCYKHQLEHKQQTLHQWITTKRIQTTNDPLMQLDWQEPLMSATNGPHNRTPRFFHHFFALVAMRGRFLDSTAFPLAISGRVLVAVKCPFWPEMARQCGILGVFFKKFEDGRPTLGFFLVFCFGSSQFVHKLLLFSYQYHTYNISFVFGLQKIGTVLINHTEK